MYIRSLDDCTQICFTLFHALKIRDDHIAASLVLNQFFIKNLMNSHTEVKKIFASPEHPVCDSIPWPQFYIMINALRLPCPQATLIDE